MEICIHTQNLTKRYGQHSVVDGVALQVPQGSVYGFLGPNGAGKTTTMKMLLGLVHPTAGEIRLMGRVLTPKTRMEMLRGVGSLIESPSYYGHLTARENLEILRSLRELPASEIERVLRLVRLEKEGSKTVAHFSLGMKQRLGIAAALLGSPGLLLLDEPTNGLDPSGIQEMRELIRSLPAQYGMTVLVSSHLLTEIGQMADHVGVICAGRLVFQDTLEALHGRSAGHLWLRTGNDLRAAELLPEAKREAEGLALPLPESDERATAISLALAREGIGVIRMELRQKTLEELFLEMTGQEETL